MKEYTLSEVIKEYEMGYRGQFKRLNYPLELKATDEGIEIINSSSNKYLPLSKSNMFECKYIKLEKEVPVHEAIKALKEGKTIYNKLKREDTMSYNTYSKEYPNIKIMTKELTDYVWYIEE